MGGLPSTEISSHDRRDVTTGIAVLDADIEAHSVGRGIERIGYSRHKGFPTGFNHLIFPMTPIPYSQNPHLGYFLRDAGGLESNADLYLASSYPTHTAAPIFYQYRAFYWGSNSRRNC